MDDAERLTWAGTPSLLEEPTKTKIILIRHNLYIYIFVYLYLFIYFVAILHRARELKRNLKKINRSFTYIKSQNLSWHTNTTIVFIIGIFSENLQGAGLMPECNVIVTSEFYSDVISVSNMFLSR